MPFPLIAALVGGALGIGSSVISRNATKQAAGAQKAAATDSNTLQRDIYNQNSTTLAPYVSQGSSYNQPINALLGSNPFKSSTGATFQESPGYQFALQQGLGAVNAGMGASGLVNSGARMKALLTTGIGHANQDYYNWKNQDNNDLANMNQATGQYLNAMTGQQGMGLSAAGAQAGVGLNYANNVSNNNWNTANATGNAALVNGANTNALMSGLAGAAGQYFGGGFMGRQSSYGAPPPAPPMPGRPMQTNYLPSMY
jgi:hypothetical protein